MAMAGASLRISEVYWMGSKERVEITNIGDEDFEDEITLKGIGNDKKINLNIPVHSSKVINEDINLNDKQAFWLELSVS